MRQIIIKILLITFAAHVGCTHSTRVPESEFEENTDKYASHLNGEPREIMFKGDYVFYLTDGSKLNPSRLTRTDSTFIIYAVYKDGKNVDVDEPIIVPISKVEKIEEISIWWIPTLTVAMGLTAVLLYFIAVAQGLGSLN